jgi:hypothetical protein
MKWLKDEYDSYQETKTHVQKQSTSSGQFGRYKPFAIMLADEGGGPGGLAACMNIVKNQIRLTQAGRLLGGQHPWFLMNKMSERVEFMHLETRFSNMMDEDFILTSTNI